MTDRLGAEPGNIGFKLPAMGKEQLFKTVMADGVLPRKTFSMGNAQDKRYYVEAAKFDKRHKPLGKYFSAGASLFVKNVLKFN